MPTKFTMALTDRQQQVCDFIRLFTARHGYGPSIRDIGKEIGVSSPNGVMCHVRSLRRKGVIADNGGIARSLILADSITVSRSRLAEALRLAEEDGNLACAEVLQEMMGVPQPWRMTAKDGDGNVSAT